MRVTVRGWIGLCLAMAVTLASSGSVMAQVGAGQVTGIVTDSSGTLVPGATVVVTNVGTTGTRETVTSSGGVYTLAGLTPGLYRLNVELTGFRRSSHEGVRIETGKTVRVDVELAVGNIQETVVVAGGAPPLRATASLGQVVSDSTVVALPLNGRSFITLASLVPGVALPPNSQLPRINGGRPRTNEYLFDGVSVLQPEPGQVAFFPIVDSIQEFKIETNSPPAEFGRFNGGVINLMTKSGSNSLRGSAFEFFRHEDLNARNYFQTANTTKPKFRRNQFGGVLGGPLWRDRTFFFVDYQGQQQQIDRTVTSTVPTLLQRQGVFTGGPVIYDPATTVSNGGGGVTRAPFPNGVIPQNRMDTVALQLLQRYPLPTAAGAANNYRRTDTEIQDQNQFDVRVDHHLATDRDEFFGRLSNFRENFVPVTPFPDGSGVTTGTLGPQDTNAWSFASNYRHIFSPSVLNEVRFGDTRRTVGRTAAQLSTSAGSALNIPGIPSYAQFPNTLPTFTVTGYQQLGSPPNTASDFNTSVSEIADTLTWVKARHTFKIGLDWRWERLNVIQPPSPTGTFLFNAIGSDLPGTTNTGTPFASFLLGQVQTFSIDLQQKQIQERARFQEYFIQDEWKVSNRMTISPGLRYTLNFPSTEINGQVAVLNTGTQQLDYPGADPVRPLKKDNFGPRFGLAYLASDGTVLSAGYGLIWIEMAGITTPFTTPTFPFLQTVSLRALDNVNPAFVLQNGPTVTPIPLTPTAGYGQGVFGVDGTLGSGYVQQWNGSAQRQITQSITFEAGYVGSKITHVGIPDTNINQLTVDQLALGTALMQRVANPYFGTIPRSSSLGDPTTTVAQLLKPYPQYTTVSLYRNNVGNTIYHGGTFRLEQRLSGGLSYLVSYTRSKLLDDASSVFDASILTGPVANYPVADSYNRKLERDFSTGDIPHLLVASANWEIPAGHGRAHTPGGIVGAIVNDWNLSTIVTLQSGIPIAVTQTTNFNAFAGFGTQRPNLVGDPELPADERTPAHWFNTAAFAVAPIYTLGSASRNPVRGPAYRNVDLAVSRRVPVHGQTFLELRIEAFNLLDNTVFGNPAATAGTAAFGTITTALDPRVIQLGVKLLF